MSSQKLIVPKIIPEQLEQVRQSGKANMISRTEVITAANELKLYDLESWVRSTLDDNEVGRYHSLLSGEYELEDIVA